MEEEKKVKKTKVAFTPEQMEIMREMLENVKEKSPNRISLYNLRDPKKIETVNVKRIDGKFVIGFKNFQKDPMKKNPVYVIYKELKERGLTREPYVTLILSDGKDIEEKEMLLLDYVLYRDKYEAKVIKIETKEIIEDHGVLGRTNEFAVAINDSGKPEGRPNLLAQIKREVRVFYVELPGFNEPVKFIGDDFLA